MPPDVELAFVAFGIGVDAGGERAAGEAHLAEEPADGFLDSDPEQRVAGNEEGVGHQLDELGIVVEHLLEMRDQPAVVDGIAGEAAAEMIVDAALGDVAEGDEHGIAVARVAGAEAGPPQHVEEAGLGELGCAADAAAIAIDVAEEALGGLVEELAVDGAPVRVWRRSRSASRRSVRFCSTFSGSSRKMRATSSRIETKAGRP